MSVLPALALSVRQPWAWAIVHAGKDIENRSIFALRNLQPIRGARAIHAGRVMTRQEYEHGRAFMLGLGIDCPPAAELPRGGIVGAVEVVDVVRSSASPWFAGPRGLVLRNAVACEFVPAIGALGYFTWTRGDAAQVPPPAMWMRAGSPSSSDEPSSSDLFGGAP